MKTLQTLLNKHGLFLHLRQDRDRTIGVTIGSNNTGNGVRLALHPGDFHNLLRAGIEFDSDGETDLGITLGVPGLTVYLSQNAWPMPQWLIQHIRSKRYRYTIAYSVSATIEKLPHKKDLSLRWNLGQDPNCWSKGEARWKRGCVSLLDTLYGREKFTSLTETRHDVVLPLPEGPIGATLVISTNKRARARSEPQFETQKFIEFPQALRMEPDKRVRGFWVSGDSRDDVLADACNKVISARVRSGLTTCGQWSVIDLAEHINGRRPDLSMGTLTDTAIARMLADYMLALQKYTPR